MVLLRTDRSLRSAQADLFAVPLDRLAINWFRHHVGDSLLLVDVLDSNQSVLRRFYHLANAVPVLLVLIELGAHLNRRFGTLVVVEQHSGVLSQATETEFSDQTLQILDLIRGLLHGVCFFDIQLTRLPHTNVSSPDSVVVHVDVRNDLICP